MLGVFSNEIVSSSRGGVKMEWHCRLPKFSVDRRVFYLLQFSNQFSAHYCVFSNEIDSLSKGGGVKMEWRIVDNFSTMRHVRGQILACCSVCRQYVMGVGQNYMTHCRQPPCMHQLSLTRRRRARVAMHCLCLPRAPFHAIFIIFLFGSTCF